MQRTFVLTSLLTCIILASCSRDVKTTEEKISGIQFIILGTAKNGEGMKLGLYIPSLDLDNRLTAVIENGTFLFKGSIDTPERASISFDEELEEPDGMYYSYNLFLDTDTIHLDIVIAERDGNYYFIEDSIYDNSVNSYFNRTSDTYAEITRGLWYNPRNTNLMDSLKKNFFRPVSTVM